MEARKIDTFALIALVLTLVAHSAAIFYWGGKVSANVQTLTDVVDDIQQTDALQEERIRLVEDAVVKLTTIQEFVVRHIGATELSKAKEN